VAGFCEHNNEPKRGWNLIICATISFSKRTLLRGVSSAECYSS
jgi:hypothetical protein